MGAITQQGLATQSLALLLEQVLQPMLITGLHWKKHYQCPSWLVHTYKN